MRLQQKHINFGLALGLALVTLLLFLTSCSKSNLDYSEFAHQEAYQGTYLVTSGCGLGTYIYVDETGRWEEVKEGPDFDTFEHFENAPGGSFLLIDGLIHFGNYLSDTAELYPRQKEPTLMLRTADKKLNLARVKL